MARATIMDAFNAANHFTEQTLGYIDEELKYKYDSRLFEQSVKREQIQNELIADFLRPDENGENVFQQNPDLYKEHVNKRLGEWKKEAAAAGDNKRYYMDKLKQMDAHFTETMRQQVDMATIKAIKQQDAVAYQKEQNTIDNAGWDIPTTLEAKIEAHNRYNKRNAMDAVTKHKDITAIFDVVFNQVRNIDIGEMTNAEANKLLDQKMTDFKETAKNYLPEGESLNDYLDGIEEKLNDTRENIKIAIGKRELIIIDKKDNEYRRTAEDAIKSEDVRLMNRAREMYREGVRLREQAMRSTEFLEKDKPTIVQMFPMYDQLFGESGRGSGGKEPDLNLSSLKYEVLKLYEGVVFGTAGVSFQELSEGKGEKLVEPLKAAIWNLAAAGDTVHIKNKEWIEKNGDSALLSYTGLQILENPEDFLPRLIENNAGAARYLSKDALSVIKAEAKRKNKNFDKKLKNGELNQEQLFNMWDLIRDCAREDNNGLSDKEYIELIDRELDLIIVNGIKESRNAKINDEKSMATAMWKWQEDPNAVFTFGDETPRYRNEAFKKDAENWIEKEKYRLSTKIGEDLRFVKYDQEPGKQSDIHVKGIYEDMNGNQYRSVAVSNDNGKTVTIKDEYREFKDGKFGEWEPAKTKPAEDKTKQPSARQQSGERMQDEAEARSKYVSNGKIPNDENGKPIADWNTLDQGMQVQVLENWSKDPNRPPEGISVEEWKNNMNQKDRLKKLYEIYGRS